MLESFLNFSFYNTSLQKHLPKVKFNFESIFFKYKILVVNGCFLDGDTISI